MISTILYLLQQIFFVSYVKSPTFKQPLSPSQEYTYIKKMQEGDNHARSMLIEHNLRLVAHIAKKYENNKDLPEDLISIGTIGLIKAIDSYSDEKATKLGTYAARCIENEILMHLRKTKKTHNDLSLDDYVGDNKTNGDLTLLDVIEAPSIPFIDRIEKQDRIQAIMYLFHNLNQREQKILTMRYGLNLSREYTQKEIAKELKISRSYVSRIEKRALIKLLKAYLEDHPKK